MLPAWPEGLKIHAEYNAIIARAAKARPQVHLIDMHRLFMNHGLASSEGNTDKARQADPNYWYFGNVEDPNDRGYQTLYGLFLDEIGKVLGPEVLGRAESRRRRSY